jgi:hypothetical protein
LVRYYAVKVTCRLVIDNDPHIFAMPSSADVYSNLVAGAGRPPPASRGVISTKSRRVHLRTVYMRVSIP